MKQEEREKIKEKIIKLLEETAGGTVSYVCGSVGISRKTFYRWRIDDEDFQQVTDEIREDKKKEMDDFAERILFKKITEEDSGAVYFYLKTRHPDYNRNKIEIDNVKDINEQRNKIKELLVIIREDNKKDVETETGEIE